MDMDLEKLKKNLVLLSVPDRISETLSLPSQGIEWDDLTSFPFDEIFSAAPKGAILCSDPS